MFAHDTAYKVRQVRDAVRLGYTVSEGIDKAFGVFDYQRTGPQWQAVNLYLADALSLGDSHDVAGRVVDLVDTAYQRARAAAAI